LDFKGGENNMAYITCKKVIANQKAAGTLDVEAMTEKLDVFLLANRITAEQYNELVGLMA